MLCQLLFSIDKLLNLFIFGYAVFMTSYILITKLFAFLIDLQMDENKPLIEKSTQSTRTRHNTTWYSPKEEEIKREVLTRLIIWGDSFYKEGPKEPEFSEDEPEGYIVFDIFDKLLYDRIYISTFKESFVLARINRNQTL